MMRDGGDPSRASGVDMCGVAKAARSIRVDARVSVNNCVVDLDF
jgi:hypothetical protein